MLLLRVFGLVDVFNLTGIEWLVLVARPIEHVPTPVGVAAGGRSSIPMRPSLLSCCAAVVCAGALLCSGSPAQAQDAVLQKVTDLNKKAVESYENLDMDEAAKFLRQALELCAAEGLNNHKAKARTHIHLGIVMV